MVCFFLLRTRIIVWFVVSIVSILQGQNFNVEFGAFFTPDFCQKKISACCFFFSSLLFSSFLFVATTERVNDINNNVLLKQLYYI